MRGLRAACFAALSAVIAVMNAAGAQTVSPVEPAKGHALTADDLDAFVDGFMPAAMERGNIAGAVLVVVKDGRVLYEKGFGVSDVEKQTPVDPGTTLFRPGSISKLFTWTAVMQLVEAHRLDLDADVNTYLDFRIPDYQGKPVTLRNLMTHTPGFEETVKNLFTTDPKQLDTLGVALKSSLPARVFTPGEVPAYSNYGAALAGYIVERVSGETFAAYVRHHIFGPLHMDHSTFVQPLPKALAATMSKGYDTASGKSQPYELIAMSPAGALAATGDDIAKFMLAHLQNGQYGGAQILRPDTATLMHGLAYQHMPPLPGIAYGFYHEDRNGHDIIGHGGDTLWFHSDLHLILDSGVGVFISQNSVGKPLTVLRGPFFKAFLDRYFPAQPLAPEPTLKTAKADAAHIAGEYGSSRGSFTNLLTVGNDFEQMKVSANTDGTISATGLTDTSGTPRKFREVAPMIWREVHGQILLVAKVEAGKVTEIESNAIPQIMVLRRSAWWQAGMAREIAFACMLTILLLGVIFWPLKAILRWNYGAHFALKGRARRLYRTTRVAALLDIAFWGGLLGWFIYALDNHLEILSTHYDWVLRGLQVVGFLGSLGAVAAIANVVVAFTDGQHRSWWTRCGDMLLALACTLSAVLAISDHALTTSLKF